MTGIKEIINDRDLEGLKKHLAENPYAAYSEVDASDIDSPSERISPLEFIIRNCLIKPNKIQFSEELSERDRNFIHEACKALVSAGADTKFFLEWVQEKKEYFKLCAQTFNKNKKTEESPRINYKQSILLHYNEVERKEMVETTTEADLYCLINFIQFEDASKLDTCIQFFEALYDLHEQSPRSYFIIRETEAWLQQKFPAFFNEQPRGPEDHVATEDSKLEYYNPRQV